MARSRAATVRIGVLVLALVAVALWAFKREQRREARTQWKHPLTVSVVLLAERPFDAAVTHHWGEAIDALGEWFTREWNRYRPPAEEPMVIFILDGMVRVSRLPSPPQEERITERLGEALAFEKELDAIDLQVPPHGRRDATIYVSLRPVHEGGGIVEGVAEAGGRRGLIDGSLDDLNLSLELTALAHEFLHCLGATDKYDPGGHAVVPQGLVDPTASPLYPQRAAEVMVGEVPLGPAQGRVVSSLDEVEVGPATAREIRWVP